MNSINREIVIRINTILMIVAPVASLISAGYLLFYGPYAGVLVTKIRDFCYRHQPLSLIYLVIFLIIMFILFSAMLFPTAVKLDKSRETWKDFYSTAMLAFGPWIDVLLKVIHNNFSIVNVDRVCLLYLGVGVFAMVFASIKSPGTAIISGIAFLGFLPYYIGLWISGGMGNTKDIIIWHATMAYMAYLSYKEWLSFVAVDPEEPENR
jgi:hypothetical protein